MRDMITLQKINDRFAEQLVEIMNVDEPLRLALEMGETRIIIDEFLTHNAEWVDSRSGDLFAIVLDDAAIGSISLSHQDRLQCEARIGYWLTSIYWGRGYTGQAFRLVLDYAQQQGFQIVRSSIMEDNMASLKIWERCGAEVRKNGDRYGVEIRLETWRKEH